MKSQPDAMHALYQALTGYVIEMNCSRRFAWELICLKFDENDLRLLVRHLKSKARNGKPARALLFRSFVAGPSSVEFWEEDLQEARAEARQSRPTPRSDILRASGRLEPTQSTARPAAAIALDLVREKEAFAARMAELRASLNL